MFLKSINLTNFRNYSNLNFEFKTPVTVLMGNNAQGKSNFLESIYFLSTTKSSKAEKDEELILNGESVARVEGEMGETKLEITMVKDENGFSKRVKVNGVARRVVDYIGNFSVVSFSPEDINLVTGSPSLRRWHIDITLAQIDKSYKNALTNYEQVVVRKNRLLKMIRSSEAKVDELDFWVNQQIELGEIIQRKRRAFFEFLNSSEKSLGDFEFEYLESPLTTERLNEYQSREIYSASSLIGPHRDDFKFKMEDRDLSHFGSRGEHRTAVLDLKLTEASFIETVLENRPILLLDDVFSELDLVHQQHVLDLISLQQTVIATVDLEPHIKEKLAGANQFLVEAGKLSVITVG